MFYVINDFKTLNEIDSWKSISLKIRVNMFKLHDLIYNKLNKIK